MRNRPDKSSTKNRPRPDSESHHQDTETPSPELRLSSGGLTEGTLGLAELREEAELLEPGPGRGGRRQGEPPRAPRPPRGGRKQPPMDTARVGRACQRSRCKGQSSRCSEDGNQQEPGVPRTEARIGNIVAETTLLHDCSTDERRWYGVRTRTLETGTWKLAPTAHGLHLGREQLCAVQLVTHCRYPSAAA